MAMCATHPFHASPADEVLAELGSNDGQGLSDSAAATRHGNAPRSEEGLRLGQFGRKWRMMPDMVFLLIGAVLLIYLSLTWLLEDALAVLATLLMLAAVIIGLHRWTTRLLVARPTMRPLTARVLRNGRDLACGAAQLVPGDIVFLEPGDPVLADMRLLQTDGLVTDEHALTSGRSQVYKQVWPVDANAPLALRSNMVYAGSHVAAGYGKAVVTAVGESTQQEVLYHTMHGRSEQEGQDILQARAVMRRTGYLALLGVSALFAVGLFGQHIQLHELFYAALVMVLAAVPFFLPLALQIVDYWGALALTQHRMHLRAPEAVALMQGIDVLMFGEADAELIARLDAAALQSLGARAVFCFNASEEKGRQLPDSIRTLTGRELLALDADEVQKAALRTDVFLAMDEQAQHYLLAALQVAGRNVAYVGRRDVDVPVMREANCAISLGEVSAYLRAHSDVVLGETPVVESIRAARSVGLRIVDIWHLLLTTAAAKGTVLAWAILSGSLLPLAPLQLLYTALLATPLLAACLAMTPQAEAPPAQVSVRGVRARKQLLPWVMITGCMLIALAVYGVFHAASGITGNAYIAGTLAWLALLLMEIALMLAIGGIKTLHYGRVWLVLGVLFGVQGVLLTVPLLQQAFLVGLPAAALFAESSLWTPFLVLPLLAGLAWLRRWRLRSA